MSKDFDGERRERHAARERGLGARDFVLSGKTFTWLPNVSYTALESLSAADEFDGAELIRAIEGAMTEMIEEDQREAFLAVLRDKDDPYTFADLNAVATWLVEEQVKRPTQPLSSSTGGGALPPIETSSKDDSSSPLAEASTG